jgi:hypothetical protein
MGQSENSCIAIPDLTFLMKSSGISKKLFVPKLLKLPTKYLLNATGDLSQKVVHTFRLEDQVTFLEIILYECHGKMILLKHKKIHWAIGTVHYIIPSPPLGEYELIVLSCKSADFEPIHYVDTYIVHVTIQTVKFDQSDLTEPKIEKWYDVCSFDFGTVFEQLPDHTFEIEMYEKEELKPVIYLYDPKHQNLWRPAHINPRLTYFYRWRVKHLTHTACWSQFWKLDLNDFEPIVSYSGTIPTLKITMPFSFRELKTRVKIFVKYDDSDVFQEFKWMNLSWRFYSIKYSTTVETTDWCIPNKNFTAILQIDDHRIPLENLRFQAPHDILFDVLRTGSPWRFDMNKDYYVELRPFGNLEYIEEKEAEYSYDGNYKYFKSAHHQIAKIVKCDHDHYNLCGKWDHPYVVLTRLNGINETTKWKATFEGNAYYTWQDILPFVDWRVKFIMDLRIASTANMSFMFK